LVTKYIYSDQIKESEMDGSCSTLGGDGKYVQNFGRKPEGKNHSEDLNVNGGMITGMGLKEIGWEVVDWILLAQDREQLLAFVNTVMKTWVP
jgi:hypothetical protein